MFKNLLQFLVITTFVVANIRLEGSTVVETAIIASASIGLSYLMEARSFTKYRNRLTQATKALEENRLATRTQRILSNDWYHRIIFGLLLSISLIAGGLFIYFLAAKMSIGAGITAGIATAVIPLGRKLNVALLAYQARSAESSCIQHDIFLPSFNLEKNYKKIVSMNKNHIKKIQDIRAKINRHHSNIDEDNFNEQQKEKINRVREKISNNEEEINAKIAAYRDIIQDLDDGMKRHDEQNTEFSRSIYDDVLLLEENSQAIKALIHEESNLCSKLSSKQQAYAKQRAAELKRLAEEQLQSDTEHRESFEQEAGSSSQSTKSFKI